MLLQSAVIEAKKLLVKITARVKEICLVGAVCKVSNRKTICLVKQFAFLENVCYQHKILCFEYLSVFLRAADWRTTNFLGMYCYFPIIRLVNFVYGPSYSSRTLKTGLLGNS